MLSLQILLNFVDPEYFDVSLLVFCGDDFWSFSLCLFVCLLLFFCFGSRLKRSEINVENGE